MSKVIRIHEDSIEIALKYGNTISEGIKTMDNLLKKQKNSINIEDIRLVIQEELENLRRY
ncbi:MAG: hypothetical protein PHV39_01670 [Methanomicrobium sp.]|nr:hypothetical protein [Methanomicrobium sp.]